MYYVCSHEAVRGSPNPAEQAEIGQLTSCNLSLRIRVECNGSYLLYRYAGAWGASDLQRNDILEVGSHMPCRNRF